MASPIRWGILSTALISHKFARDFAHAQGGALVAVASRDEVKAQAFARQYDIPRAYGDYASMLADPDIDAVYISTPHNLHYQNSIDCIAAGKAVLCEKPLTVTPEEARALTARARESGVYLMEAMWTWLLPAIREARRWVDSGRIGALLHMKIDMGHPMPYDPEQRHYSRELAGGCLLDIGVYPLALAWHFTGQDPEVLSVRSHLAPNGVDDDVLIHCDYGECSASLMVSFRCKLPNAVWLIGEKGYIRIPDFWRARECFLYEQEDPVDYFLDQRAGSGFEYQITEVNRDLQAGRRRPEMVTWEDSVRVQEHLDLLYSRMDYRPAGTAVAASGSR